MYDTQNALIAHLDAVKDSLGLATVAAYSGQFSKADDLSDPLPAALTFFHEIETSKTRDRLEFGLLIVNETLLMEREEGAQSTMTIARTVYEWLQNHPIFSDLNFKFAIVKPGGFKFFVGVFFIN